MPRPLLLLLLPLLLIAGCGQSGDLYLPGNAPERSDVLEDADDTASDGQAEDAGEPEDDDTRDGDANG
ncbi:lipoprotein [Algiphilus sp.]|uniref:LPS translocon maturation chaperone LptM n=1 Tax=Algiphilus sp. TaxID=1872431 RepID=UPI0025BD1646|nr:lipoprotein [Algiphilus sp.]MCK5771478.1 lipoprotein [Algiphilus sp.]